ncbi:MAG: potassium-transporting ATPase subunit C [Candidatus Thermoplasmatota archaeon]|nr:potassium-transporting ATPase subunit C [Candidatus Thermoplasmatota archaeon]
MKTKSVLKLFAFAALFMFILGFVYPTVSSIVAEGIDPFQANGSLIEENGTVYGSYLLAQAFNESYFFQPRPSATGYSYSGSGSGSYALDANQTLNQTRSLISRFISENPTVNISRIPYSMVSYSGSGVDPDIPLLGAQDQIPRITGALHFTLLAAGKNVSNTSLESFLNDTVSRYTVQNFPLFGSYYVNTVQLNLAILNLLIGDGALKGY